MSRHRCELCRPDMLKTFGRDAWCPNYMRENIEAQLSENSEEGRAIRTAIKEENEGKPRPS